MIKLIYNYLNGILFLRKKNATQLEKKIGYVFKNRNLFYQSLTHKSYSQNDQNNERLEFLGDAVLGLVLGEKLMHKYPDVDEGILSKMRSSLVSTKTFYKKAKQVGIHEDLVKVFGKKAIRIKHNPRLMASFFEAVIGALYIDAGFETVKQVVDCIFKYDLAQDWVDQDYKTIFQGKSQKLFQTTPEYHVINESGPAHQKTFLVQVTLNQKNLGEGQGRTKKDAEQMAAKEAIESFDRIFSSELKVK